VELALAADGPTGAQGYAPTLEAAQTMAEAAARAEND
jgi:hypothetical protein